MADTSEVLGAEILALELLGYGGTYYADTEVQASALASGDFGGARVRDSAIASNGVAAAGFGQARVVPCSLASAGASSANMNTVRLRPSVMSAAQAQAIVAWYMQKFAAARLNPVSASVASVVSGAVKDVAMQGQGATTSSLTPFAMAQTTLGSAGSSSFDLERAEIQATNINAEGVSEETIRAIGLVDYIDATNGLVRLAEMRPMARGLRDDDMHVFAQPGMTRAAEERDMVAP